MSASKPSSGPRRGFRPSTWVQLIGANAAIFYGIVAIVQGLAQQSQGLSPDRIDCDYRVQLLRDRAIALTAQTPRGDASVSQDDVLSNLIRETRTACVARGEVESVHHLDIVEQHLHDLLAGRERIHRAEHELSSL